MTVPALPPALQQCPRTYEGLLAVEQALTELVAPLLGTVVDLGGGRGIALERGCARYSPCDCHFRAVELGTWPRATGWRGVLRLPARSADLPDSRDHHTEDWRSSGGRNTAERRLIALQQACDYFACLGFGISFEEMPTLPTGDWHTWRELRGPCTPPRLTALLAQSLGRNGGDAPDELDDLAGRLSLLDISDLPDAAWQVAWVASAHTRFPGTHAELVGMALAVAAAPARPARMEQR